MLIALIAWVLGFRLTRPSRQRGNERQTLFMGYLCLRSSKQKEFNPKAVRFKTKLGTNKALTGIINRCAAVTNNVAIGRFHVANGINHCANVNKNIANRIIYVVKRTNHCAGRKNNIPRVINYVANGIIHFPIVTKHGQGMLKDNHSIQNSYINQLKIES